MTIPGDEVDKLRNRADELRDNARRILNELDLLGKWRRFGRPVVVGAVAYNVMVDRDIDMEIYCPALKIEDGFTVLRECAEHSLVDGAEFVNALAEPDKALYWKLLCHDHTGERWKIDMWTAPEDYNLPRGESMIEPMCAALTHDTRLTILRLKEARRHDESLHCLSIDLYRAVLADGVRSRKDLRHWLQTHETGKLTEWVPEKSNEQS